VSENQLIPPEPEQIRFDRSNRHLTDDIEMDSAYNFGNHNQREI